MPFSQAVRASLEARKHRRPRTLQEIRYMAARMMKKCPELARKQVRSITPEDCGRYLRKSFSTPRQRHKGRLILSEEKEALLAAHPGQTLEEIILDITRKERAL